MGEACAFEGRRREMFRKKTIRAVGFSALLASLVLVWACIQRPMKVPVPDNITIEEFTMPQSAERDVDILFVIDNSLSMENEQQNIKTNFVALMSALEEMQGGLPNVHIGVVTPNLGTGSYTDLGGCQEIGGDAGILGKVGPTNKGDSCIGPGQRYIVDIEPTGCVIDKDDEGACTQNECGQADCDAEARESEVLTYYEDARGCPRCRNYTGTLTDTFSCLAEVGTGGCGFEQQLEAMYKALDVEQTQENAGFLRESAFMGVILLTDEDDCSASAEILFDPTQNDINTTLGYRDSFRCFEFGVECDTPETRQPGPRTGCEPLEDDQALLHQIARYTSFIETIKDPTMTVVAAISGPVNQEIMVEVGTDGKPEVKPTCVDSSGQGAKPGIRIEAFVEHFNDGEAMNEWAYTSVCQTDFSATLQGIGEKLAEIMSEKCPVKPFAGCPMGPSGTTCSPCLPDCTVFDIQNRGREAQRRMRVHWCGHVCQNGLCTQADMSPCDFDEGGKCMCADGLSPTRLGDDVHCAPLLYPSAPERERDETLLQVIPQQEPPCLGPDCPEDVSGVASACWYLTGNTTCEHGAGFKIIRGEDPPPQTFAIARCGLIPMEELFCHDGRDNDQDCLIDEEDALDCPE
jgi:hypothetical protein